MTLPPSLLLLLCLFRHGLEEEVSARRVEEGDCAAVSVETQRAVGAAVSKLGVQLLQQQLHTGAEQPNLLLSPLSISLTLAQLALGAVNQTEEQLLEALHARSLPDYHKTLSCLQEQLMAKAVNVASRIYLKPGLVLQKDFVEKSVRLFKSAPASLTSLDEVNQWVEEMTKGHIHNFLSTLPPSVVLMLINAVHFKGEWKSRFDSRYTAKGLFYIDKQTAVKVDMMMGSKYPLSMFVDAEQGTQVARFPFQGNTSLLVVMPMPSQNLSRAAANLNISDLYERLPSETTMLVKLPKFKVEYKQDLQHALTSMGLGSLFSGPELSGIAEGPLLVSGVLHTASMELSEEGAEASAATAVVLVRTIPTFAVNMPFAFAIVDDISRTPLFLGVVTNPDPGATAEQSDDPEILSLSSNGGEVEPSEAPQNDDPYWENMLDAGERRDRRPGY